MMPSLSIDFLSRLIAFSICSPFLTFTIITLDSPPDARLPPTNRRRRHPSANSLQIVPQSSPRCQETRISGEFKQKIFYFRKRIKELFYSFRRMWQSPLPAASCVKPRKNIGDIFVLSENAAWRLFVATTTPCRNACESSRQFNGQTYNFLFSHVFTGLRRSSHTVTGGGRPRLKCWGLICFAENAVWEQPLR